MNVQHHF